MNQQTNNPELNITPEDIRAEVLKNIQEGEEQEGAFTFKEANAWLEEASKEPIPRQLFDQLWYEGEVCILFADTNVGKSILAVQIGDSISCGCPVPGFALEAEAQPILYFDFELSKKQFENRYSHHYTEHHVFCSNFTRVELDTDAEPPEGCSMEQYIARSMEQLIQRTGAKVLIVDNITYLGTENEKAKEALPLMKHLKRLKKRYHLSILALAHTPKRDPTRPLTDNDVQGSRMIPNFVDSSFAIGRSFKDEDLRYIKQIKERQDGKAYGSHNVCVCRIAKPHNFLGFQLLGYGTEAEHLKQQEEVAEKDELATRVLELKAAGKSVRDIAKELEITASKVQRVLAKSA